MKVLHVIPSLSAKHGGPSVALPLIARSLLQMGVEVDVATTDDDGPGARLNIPLAQRQERDGWGMYYFRKQLEFYKVSLPFSRWVRREVREYDLVHIHALFSHTSVAAARGARRAGVPYLIRPLGVLNRWGMTQRRPWLKALSFRFIEKPVLRHAAAMHYTSEAERHDAEEVGATAPGHVIPLGLDVQCFKTLPSPECFLQKFPQARGRDLLLFLSRVDKMKGLDLLLPAYVRVSEKFPNSLLVIAGSGEADYQAALRQQAHALGIHDRVLWSGFVGGEEKLAALAAARVFTLPSHSESFGIALVEALAAGLPCVTTEGVAVSRQVLEHQAGLVVPGNVEALTEALSRMLGDATLRARLGANARRLAVEHFSLEAMGTALFKLYQQILATQQTA